MDGVSVRVSLHFDEIHTAGCESGHVLDESKLAHFHRVSLASALSLAPHWPPWVGPGIYVAGATIY